jgi:hypothetical protein
VSDDQFIAFLAVILLLGKNYKDPLKDLAMLEEEKRIAVIEARDLLELVGQIPPDATNE